MNPSTHTRHFHRMIESAHKLTEYFHSHCLVRGQYKHNKETAYAAQIWLLLAVLDAWHLAELSFIQKTLRHLWWSARVSITADNKSCHHEMQPFLFRPDLVPAGMSSAHSHQEFPLLSNLDLWSTQTISRI